MRFVHKLFLGCFIAILFWSNLANAALITAQLSDENPGIQGYTYIDGDLVQEMFLGTESYDGRFTGFILFDEAVLSEDVAERVNIFASSTGGLIGTLRLSGNAGTGFVHTSYFSAFSGGELEPLVFATGSLVADGSFQDIIRFTASNGDHYVFQYRNIVAEVPEPPILFFFPISFILLWMVRRLRREMKCLPTPVGSLSGR